MKQMVTVNVVRCLHPPVWLLRAALGFGALDFSAGFDPKKATSSS